MGNGKGNNKRINATLKTSSNPILVPRVDYNAYFEWLNDNDYKKLKLATYYLGLTDISSRRDILDDDDTSYILTEFFKDLVDIKVVNFLEKPDLSKYEIKYTKENNNELEQLQLRKIISSDDYYILGAWENKEKWPTQINIPITFKWAATNKDQIKGCNHITIISSLLKNSFPG